MPIHPSNKSEDGKSEGSGGGYEGSIITRSNERLGIE